MSEKKPTYMELQAERDAYKAENDALKRDRVNRQAKNSVFLHMPEDQIKDAIIQRYNLTPTYAQNFLDDDSDPDDSRPWAL